MKRRTAAWLLSLCLLSVLAVPAHAADAGLQRVRAVYLGVEQYGAVDRSGMRAFRHRFWINGSSVAYPIAADSAYSIQNQLQEGYVYDITVKNGSVTAAAPAAAAAEGAVAAADGASLTVGGRTIPLDGAAVCRIASAAGGAAVTAASAADLQAGRAVKAYEEHGRYTIYLTPVAEPYTAPVSGTPGLKTLKNFLATAMEPVGTTLYVYGGAWNWQDTGASMQASSIGLPQSWVDFFQRQTADYTYKHPVPADSYYPFGRWNQYYYAGADCSGYVGWVVYNTMHTQSGGTGYVQDATTMAQAFADLGWGAKTQNIRRSDFRPGDIMSMNGHIWICLGACDDGSLVILHSTPSGSVTGQRGGGVQINGVGDSENCQAVQLARTYMSRYFPAWYSRYHSVYKNYASYTSFSAGAAGKFSWDIGGVLDDPDGYRNMRAEEILADLFGETNPITAAAGQGGTIVPSGTVHVKAGDPQSFVIAPDDGYEIASVIVDGVDVTNQLVNGRYTFACVDRPHAIQASFRAGDVWFVDVPAGTYAYDAVRWAVENHITQGTEETVFGPEERCTRAQAVTLLWRAAGAPQAADEAVFADVPDDAFYADAVRWAADAGVAQGMDDARFGPDESVTRGQAVTLLWRAAGAPQAADEAAFADVPDDAFYADAVRWAVGAGVTQGTAPARFSPDEPCTRGQLVTLLYRAAG